MDWQIKPNGTFLDIGCGTGFVLEKVHKEKNCNATGIDANPGVCGVKSEYENEGLREKRRPFLLACGEE